MALVKTAVPILKFAKPLLAQPCFLPDTVNVQVRYAARKGYREKTERAKKEKKKEIQISAKASFQMRGKAMKYEKTVNLKKPEPPPDDVIIANNFNYMKYSLSEAVKFHREYHHPTIYNNPNAPVVLNIEINMTGKTEFQVIKPFSNIISIPHPFLADYKREVLVLCKPEDVEMAKSCGASVAGGADIIAKIKEGLIQPSLYDYIIAHNSLQPELYPIRKILKTQIPRVNKGTLTKNLPEAIQRFLHGIQYSCGQIGTAKAFGVINCKVGLINMELDHLEENFKVLIEDIEKHKVKKDREFITWVWCSSPPSNESFSIDLDKYLERNVADDDDDVGTDKEKEIDEEKKANFEILQYEEQMKKSI